ncbi:MAG: Nif3-like dinuclear metal center hexameric protein [Candidatus Hodarchaeota archaeon]
MYLEDIISLLENKIAPKSFNVDSEIYGIHYGSKQNDKVIKKVLLTVNLDLESIHFAIKNKVNLIISIYPLITEPLTKFNSNLINKLSLLSKFPITIFALNLAYMGAQGGVTDTIMEALYLQLDKIFEIKTSDKTSVPIGRICFPKRYIKNEKPITLETLIKRVKSNLKMKTVNYVGDIQKIIEKVCIIAGNLNFLKILKESIKEECDSFVIGNIDYFLASYAKDLGLTLIEVSQYEANLLSVKKLYNILSLQYPHEEFFIFDSKSPLKTYI